MTIFNKLHQLQDNASLNESFASPYILCNEQLQQVTLTHLAGIKTHTNPSKEVHVGFSVWFNLDIIAATRPAYAAVFDIDPWVTLFVYPSLKDALLNSTTIQTFIEHFLNKIALHLDFAPLIPMLHAQITELRNSEQGFLSSESNFLHIQSMIKENKIFFGKANITSQSDMGIIKDWISTNDLQLKTLYVSNIPEWLMTIRIDHLNEAKTQIASLLHPQTLLIDAFYPTSKKDKSGPPLRITQGELPQYTLQPFSQRLFSKKHKRNDDSEPHHDLYKPVV